MEKGHWPRPSGCLQQGPQRRLRASSHRRADAIRRRSQERDCCLLTSRGCDFSSGCGGQPRRRSRGWLVSGTLPGYWSRALCASGRVRRIQSIYQTRDRRGGCVHHSTRNLDSAALACPCPVGAPRHKSPPPPPPRGRHTTVDANGCRGGTCPRIGTPQGRCGQAPPISSQRATADTKPSLTDRRSRPSKRKTQKGPRTPAR